MSRTIDDCLCSLGLKGWNGARMRQITSWPPDVFAAAILLLRDSGAYLHCLDPHVPSRPKGWDDRHTWSMRMQRTGQKWARDVRAAPPPVAAHWKRLARHAATPVADIRETSLWTSLVELAACADEACQGAGLSNLDDFAHMNESGFERSLHFLALVELYRSLDLHGRSTMARLVDPSVAVVLPKTRTPQSGVTIRSMSHHLAFFDGREIKPLWNHVPRTGSQSLINPDSEELTPESSRYNILLVPYPYTVNPLQFQECGPSMSVGGLRNLFCFRHQGLRDGPAGFRRWLHGLVREAQTRVGTIHGLVLPEAAMSWDDARSVFGEEDVPFGLRFLVCGVTSPPTRTALGRNAVMVRWDSGGEAVQHMQDKHHRWKVDGAQIRMYHLSSVLDPDRNWWEAINIAERRLGFLNLDSQFTFTVLICEDLARPDPVGDLIRAVGPNLVIALLQDGPQLKTRWPARFAGGLADDPGSSVLTVTSLGMVQAARPFDRMHEPPSRCVAMWRDRTSDARELFLPADAEALAITLVRTAGREYTADGRNDRSRSGNLTLGGVHPIRAANRPPPHVQAPHVQAPHVQAPHVQAPIRARTARTKRAGA